MLLRARIAICLCPALLATAARASDAGARAEYDLLAKQIKGSAKWNMPRVEREVLRREALILSTDRTPVDIVLRRTRALLDDIGRMAKAPDLSAEAAALDALEKRNGAELDDAARRALFAEARALRRGIAFRNPLLDFDRIVFLTHGKQARGERHMVDQYLAGASPVPMGLSMMARAKFAEILGSPDLQGVKTTGNFAGFGRVSPGESSQPTPKDIFITAAIPISDYKEFIEGNPNVGEPDSKGISTVSGPGIPEMVAMKRTGNYVLLTRDYDELLAVAKSISAKAPSLAATLDEDMTHQALNEPIWAHGNIELVHKTFGQVITTQLENMKKMISQAQATQAQAMGTAQPIDPSAIIDVYVRVLEALLNQTRSLTITLNPEPTVLTISETIAAIPGTEMANMFTAGQDPVKENKFLGHLQDGAVMNLAARINTPLWRTFNLKSIDLMVALAGESMTAEETAKWRKLAQDAIDTVAGPVAFSFSIDPNT